MAKPIVLLVESDPPTIQLYRGALETEYEVLASSSESGALEALSSSDVRAVILEPALESGRGWGILTAIQSAICERPIPVIVCTTSDERKRGLEMGAAAFLVKPVLPGVLLETLRRFQRSEPLG